MNKVILIGRVVRDPKIFGSNASKVGKFTIAVDRKVKREDINDKQTADFIPCTAFGNRVDFVEKYLVKGKKVAVVGRLCSGEYTDRDGKRIFSLDMVVDDIEFVESKSAEESRNASNGYSNNRPQSNYDYSDARYDAEGFMNIPDGIEEELPFK